jgi:hypothetical protein
MHKRLREGNNMSMNQNHTTRLVEIPIGGPGGLVWNQLHDEREDICRRLLEESNPRFDERKEMLQARLRRVDDALDRLMARTH